VASKTAWALKHGLDVILCCGESLETREANDTVPYLASGFISDSVSFIKNQLEAVLDVVKDWSSIVIAYEPIWAIGTGKVATPRNAHINLDSLFSRTGAGSAC
jgi:triosephosphate isomerase (TIM)